MSAIINLVAYIPCPQVVCLGGQEMGAQEEITGL